MLIRLFISFVKIGLFSFGGGYAMIPLIQQEIVNQSWLTTEEFINIISIAEMTPGPFAINSATYIGITQNGVTGALVSTIGVVLPSFAIVMALSSIFTRYREHRLLVGLLYGIRPVVAALIASAALLIARTALVDDGAIEIRGIIILVLSFLAVKRFKVHPILMIVGAALLGMLIY
ncbi:MAG: chromate transporter [Mahellales bacterium]|jgi:chromate transporter